MPWKEFYCYSTKFTALVQGVGTQAAVDNEIRIDPDSDFEFIKTIFNPVSAQVRLRYRDDTNGRYLMKGFQDCRQVGACAIYSFGGSPIAPGHVPFIWPRPYIISGGTTFTVGAADFLNSATAYDFYLTFLGSKIRNGPAPYDFKKTDYRAIVPYVYQLTATSPFTMTVAANSANQASIATDRDAHFLCYKVVGSRTGQCTLTVKDAARDRQWMDSATHFDNFVGNGHYPNTLPSPRFVAKGSVITVAVNDLSGASNVIEMNFIGVKLYE